jgi:hypothetical protein
MVSVKPIMMHVVAGRLSGQTAQSSDGCRWKTSWLVKRGIFTRRSTEASLVVSGGLSGPKEAVTGCQKIG